MMNQETNLRIQEFIARHQYMQYRESLSIKSLEEKIKNSYRPCTRYLYD